MTTVSYSGFELIDTIKDGSVLNLDVYLAEVIETTFKGALWWKTETSKVRKVRRRTATHWFFEDTGEWTPMFEIETLARAYTVETGKTT